MKLITSCTCQGKTVKDATLLAAAEGGGVREELYQRETGEYVLLGQGSSGSEYAHFCCGMRVAGSKTKDFTPEQALRWAEEKLEPEQCHKLFPQA